MAEVKVLVMTVEGKELDAILRKNILPALGVVAIVQLVITFLFASLFYSVGLEAGKRML